MRTSTLPILKLPVRTGPVAMPLPLVREPGDTLPPMVCRMIFDEICVLANGDIVCSCGDPAGKRVYGNVYTDRIADVYNGPLYQEMRQWQLDSRPDSWCHVVDKSCPGRTVRATAVDGPTGRHAKFLQLEPVSYCNLRCPACPVTHFGKDPDYLGDRIHKQLPLEVMLDVVDQLPDLETLLFHNFGEPFLHPDAVAFLREVRRRRPDLYLAINTNGLVMTPAQIDAVASEALLNKIVFSIDGADPESYRKYRVGGDLTKALRHLEALVIASRNAGTRDRIEIHWQYILFEWNDSDEEIAQAQAIARRIGVPIRWTLTTSPSPSKRYVDGSEAFARLVGGGDYYHALNCDLLLGNFLENGAVPRGRYLARLSCDPMTVSGTVGSTMAMDINLENLSRQSWDKGQSDAYHLGAMLRSASGRKIREIPGAMLPTEAIRPGGRATVTVPFTLPQEPGSYQVLIDVVENHVCWFFERGSQPLVLQVNAHA